MRTGIILALTVAIVAVTAGGALRAQDATLTGASAFGDWTKDAPGVWRKIVPADIPKPGASPGQSISKLVARPPARCRAFYPVSPSPWWRPGLRARV